jgi:hypothetical protein
LESLACGTPVLSLTSGHLIDELLGDLKFHVGETDTPLQISAVLSLIRAQKTKCGYQEALLLQAKKNYQNPDEYMRSILNLAFMKDMNSN